MPDLSAEGYVSCAAPAFAAMLSSDLACGSFILRGELLPPPAALTQETFVLTPSDLLTSPRVAAAISSTPPAGSIIVPHFARIIYRFGTIPYTPFVNSFYISTVAEFVTGYGGSWLVCDGRFASESQDFAVPFHVPNGEVLSLAGLDGQPLALLGTNQINDLPHGDGTMEVTTVYEIVTI